MYSGFVNTEKDLRIYVFKLLSKNFLRSPSGNKLPNTSFVFIISFCKSLAEPCSIFGSSVNLTCPFKYAKHLI